jgi:hypothetical protein
VPAEYAFVDARAAAVVECRVRLSWRAGPHRLVAQDVALSRPKPGFESP